MKAEGADLTNDLPAAPPGVRFDSRHQALSAGGARTLDSRGSCRSQGGLASHCDTDTPKLVISLESIKEDDEKLVMCTFFVNL
ncbi:hypothetical protein PoB_002814200 [Plakobranchus ocellatus]|uniref:Uncharacterized protein n=1 Tax=Plakobranchus ocellatus TaxID=259542 RepID=A0AAV4A423_9GAST|nr:hypothetical protein PoB_002814200 [Plakobranchus ocellatus]